MICFVCYPPFLAPTFSPEPISPDDSLCFTLAKEFHRVSEEIRRYKRTLNTGNGGSISTDNDEDHPRKPPPFTACSRFRVSRMVDTVRK